MLNVKSFQIENFIPANYQDAAAPRLAEAQEKLQKHTGLGHEFTDWVRLPVDYDKEEFARVQAAAKKIQADSKALVVIGIGGSYLGARGVVEYLCSPNYNQKKKDTPNIYFMGNGLSADAMQEVFDLIGDQDFSVNVISKSGTTTEPAVAFRFFREALEKKYGKDGAKGRIYATTDKARGALKSLANEEGWESFVVPDGVGGRYSVLTAVGLLPIAVAGVDIEELMGGAAKMMKVCETASFENPAWTYAALRDALYQKGWSIEVWPATIPPSALCWNGGSSSTAKARARTARASSPPVWSSPRTCTPWASTFRPGGGSCLRPWCVWGPRSTSCWCPGTRSTATG